jgi:hypothetical protein
MEIQINRAEKLELLKACQRGVLDTDKIPELKKMRFETANTYQRASERVHGRNTS